ncbi:sugar transferase [Haloplanus aerogenes]|uniref:Lipopolysaccharide/colanic/teichoic acid biosynthesis glycosyltransferase n=2 Tax=Haloplanus aerogenes TaxID=660522 RepID=A0A3M0D4L0_9EURY|nr:sugar transferase [Haloplanus aerogenes]RMB13896.1 lipopolysaccharide/colanic/teichoic acid biosynthesis glycosyltransferase [Haloplanus aerogenes]
MLSGWRYRLVSGMGAVALAVGSVSVANHPVVQQLAVMVPVFNRLPATTLSNGDLSLALATMLFVVLAALVPLFKPRPRRVLDTIMLVEQRVFLAAVALAAIGYFDYTYRLPRTTLVLATLTMGVLFPVWFVVIRRSPRIDPERTVVVGDDPGTIEDVIRETNVPIEGYISSFASRFRRPLHEGGTAIATPDGGTVSVASVPEQECLGGLARLEDVLIERDIDTVVFAFEYPDQEEFFGSLDTCHRMGVNAKVHHRHADTVLTTGLETGELVDIDVEPWDWQSHVLKRAFDIAFALAGLLVLGPVMLLIALAIKLDDGGPVFYAQQRTAEFGDTFTVYKFRTMVPEGESATPLDDEENDRITRVGRILRKTHLDEVPQLLTILSGQMSVVGPRAVWVDEEVEIESEVSSWCQRWFVKPGLTGLAQINGVTSTDPDEKLRYDVAYIRNQSFWFDVRIVIRQLWMVFVDAIRLLR